MCSSDLRRDGKTSGNHYLPSNSQGTSSVISGYGEPVGQWGPGGCGLFVDQHCVVFPASGRPGGALAGEYASDSRIRHSPGSAVAFLKRLADSGNNQRY